MRGSRPSRLATGIRPAPPTPPGSGSTLTWPRTRRSQPSDSQGGLIATQLLRTRPERVAATVVLSGFVQAAPQPADEQLAAERPAVFWGRGARDPMIPADAIERTRQWLTAHSTLTERVYPGLAHGISNQEIADVRAFLSDRTGGGVTR
jgi:phospholipase/carboxylesterase